MERTQPDATQHAGALRPLLTRTLVFVSAEFRNQYFRECKAIDRRWPHFESDPNIDLLRAHSHRELREDIKTEIKNGLFCESGIFPLAL
jgi:hypothetical protein